MLASLHLFRVRPSRVPLAAARMALDRRRLRAAPGLRFAKLVGTGDGRTFTVRDADPCTWGLFAVWDGPGALGEFERRSATAAAWRRLADERWRADLRPLRSRGRWSGREPFGAAPPPAGRAVAGPVAALTRARLRPGTMRVFWRAVPPVSADASARDGLLFAVGFGEAPVGVQGTFSVWADQERLGRFAYAGAAHRAAIRDTKRRRWYSEDLFARFEVVATSGTVRGRDPLTPG